MINKPVEAAVAAAAGIKDGGYGCQVGSMQGWGRDFPGVGNHMHNTCDVERQHSGFGGEIYGKIALKS